MVGGLSPYHWLAKKTAKIMVNNIDGYYMVYDGFYYNLVGSTPTPPKNDGVRQLGL